jgi:hypothetical protein
MSEHEMVEYLEKICRDLGMQVRREFLGEDNPGSFVRLRGRPTVFLNSTADAVELLPVLFHALLGVKPYDAIKLRADVQAEFDRWWAEQHR